MDGVIFHMTAKLRKKLKVEPTADAPEPAHPLLSWYANLFYGGNRQHLLVTHEATLFSVVFPGRGLTSADLFAERFHLMMYSYLEALRLGAAFKLLIAPYTKGITLAKTTNKSVLSSMNDSIYRCKLSLYEFDYSEMELSNIVNQVPKGALGYRMPLEAFVILLRQLIPPTISTNGKEELP